MDRVPDQGVAEGEAGFGRAEQAAREALLDLIEHGASDGLEQVRVDLRADDRRHVEHAPGLGGEAGGAGQDSIAHRGRNRFVPGGEDFGEEERVAPSQPVQFGGIATAANGHALHRVR